MEETILKIITSLFNPSTILVPWIASLCMIILPNNMLGEMGLIDFKNNHITKIGIIFLLSSAYLITIVLKEIYRIYLEKKIDRIYIQRFKQLDDVSRQIIYEIYFSEGQSKYYPISSAKISVLEELGLITRSSISSVASFDGPHFNYTLEPWLFNYLKKNEKRLGLSS